MSICRTNLAALLAAGVIAASASGQGAGQIIATELEDVDSFLVGTITEAEGALPRTLWSGSDPAAIAEAASQAPDETDFLAAAALAGRALLSPGPSPEGAGDKRQAAQARLEALLNLGLVDAADSIVSLVPRGLDEPEFAAVAVRARLAKNDIVSACQVGDALPTGRDGAFWLRLRTACYAWAGESAAAQLTLDLATEADPGVADEDFATWIFAAASKAAPEDAPSPRDPLESALAQSSGYVFDEETLARQPLLVAVGLARDDEAAPDVRALAARRAARAGALSPQQLAAALEAVPVETSSNLASMIASARSAPYPVGEALLYRVAEAQAAGPFEVAEAFEVSFARAETPADFIVTARMLEDELRALTPSEDLTIVASQFALAAAAIGDIRLAYRWLDPRAPGLAGPGLGEGFQPILNAAPDFSRSPVGAAERVSAEAVVAAADPSATPARLAAAARARLESTLEGDPAEQAAARRDVLILIALGAEVTPELRRAATEASSEGAFTSDVAIQALAQARYAADARALGETALYLAQATADAGPLDSTIVASAIEIARRVGLEEDARALAVEAMLASRIGPLATGE